MKVPVASNENWNSAAGNGWYEPKSVLELRRSPSPVLDQKAAPAGNFDVSDDPLELADNLLTNFEDWDSFMKELGLQDDRNIKPDHNLLFTPSSESQTHQFEFTHSLPEFVPSSDFNFSQFQGNINSFDENWSFGFDYIDELIQFAECFDSNAVQLAQVILPQLNQKLSSAAGNPLRRAAFYFKEALQSLLTGSTRPASSSFEVIQTIKAYKIFSNISPIPMFSSFTANQAMLEAVDGAMLVHVIDFDIGFGSHWASFMKELADKAESTHTKPPILRVTALVQEEYAVESRLIRENLAQFARELNIGLDVDFVLIRTFELLSFKAIKFIDGEKIVVLLSPAIFRRVGSGQFAADLRRVSPHVVVHVDSEGVVGPGPSSFRQTVIEGLEFYSGLLESLEAANVGGDWIKKIENFVLFPKIVETVGAAGGRGMTWKEAFVAAGFRPVGLSQFADFQANLLLGKVQIGGFHVAKRHAEMLLCWHDRALVATSAWR
ncbi:PREDICTED: scarecrow-like protein 15 [Ipomoea nil]|uniref:scarecrow-like protein 15 n=1 Tax=Ipomoea nil TaxID=35883 RepID=UPI000901783A|nr:PREDICTED: scarecrow-like protein 15 [Ipomoea nil]